MAISLNTQFVHRSATTLKTLIGEVNNICHLVTVQCSAWKPLGPGIYMDAT